MHIAFFNRSFHPDQTATGQLLTDLCESLVRDHGCRVSVVAGVPLQPPAGAAAGSRALLSRERHGGVEILRARGTRFSKRRFAGRASNYVSYFLAGCYAGLRLDRPDVVIAQTDPPIIGLAAWLCARRFGVPLVMAYQDVFPEVAVLLDDFRSDTVDAMLQGVNRFLCRRATRIVAIGETMRRRLIESKGAPLQRTVVIHNWADTNAITPGPKDNAFARAHGLTDKFVVMHSGNLGLSQGLDAVIEAAAVLRAVPDIQIVFQGDGVKRDELQQRARALALSNVTFLPFQPKERLAESFASADVFIVSLQRGLAGYIVPSKLYGILASGRPYVAAVEEGCEVAAITRSHDCGLVAEPGDPRDLAEKILAYHRDRVWAAQAGVNARRASAAFDRGVAVRRYFELCRELVTPTMTRALRGVGIEEAR